MDSIINRLKAFFFIIFIRIFQIFPRAQLPAPPAPVADRHNHDWAMIMIGFCLPSAVEIALQSMQIPSQLPPMFHFLSVAIIFSFTFLFLGKFISTDFPITALVLQRVGVFFAVTAIFVAITIPLPLWLKCFTWALYVVSFIAIVVCIICHGHIV